MKLSDIDLSPDEVRGLRFLLAEWHRAAGQAQEARAVEAEQDALNERRAAQITEIAQQYATQHGPLEWMSDAHQATAAYDSWFDGAGYVDLDGAAEIDYAEQELWEQAYIGRLEELRRERRQP
jgi:hypothetical protein